MAEQNKDDSQIEDFGQVVLDEAHEKQIYLMTIIGEIEGH